MKTLAIIHWGYVGLVLVGVCAFVAGWFLITLIRHTRAIAKAGTDDFRLSIPNIWTEAHHTSDGGSFQLMRLKDDNFVLISIGVTTAKIFVTPDRADMARYREEGLSAAQRFGTSSVANTKTAC